MTVRREQLQVVAGAAPVVEQSEIGAPAGGTRKDGHDEPSETAEPEVQNFGAARQLEQAIHHVSDDGRTSSSCLVGQPLEVVGIRITPALMADMPPDDPAADRDQRFHVGTLISAGGTYERWPTGYGHRRSSGE